MCHSSFCVLGLATRVKRFLSVLLYSLVKLNKQSRALTLQSYMLCNTDCVVNVMSRHRSLVLKREQIVWRLEFKHLILCKVVKMLIKWDKYSHNACLSSAPKILWVTSTLSVHMCVHVCVFPRSMSQKTKGVFNWERVEGNERKY